MAAVPASSGPLPLAEIVGLPNPPPVGAADQANAPGFERYEKIAKLGEGTYGVVYKARDRLKDCMVALKKVRMDAWEEGVPATALREISALKELAHPNIVQLHDVFVSFSGNLYLVFELLERDLKQAMDAVRHRGGLEEDLVRVYLYQLLTAVEACHAHRLIHRDLKPQNVLLGVAPPGFDAAASAAAGAGAAAGGAPALPAAAAADPASWAASPIAPTAAAIASAAAATVAAAGGPSHPPLPVLKLADFGLARTFALPLRPYTHEIITLWYRCPEVLLGLDVYSAAVDIWSAGCIFAEMASGAPLFTGDSEIDQLYKTFAVLGTPSAAEWPLLPRLPDYSQEFPKWPAKPWSKIAPALCEAGRDLLSQMLRYNPAERISAAEALAHPYFAPLHGGGGPADAPIAAPVAAEAAAGGVGAPAAAAGAGAGGGGSDMLADM